MALERLRYASVDFLVATAGSTAEALFRMQLPARPGMALLVHSAWLEVGEGASMEGQRKMGLTHNLEQAALDIEDKSMWVMWSHRSQQVSASSFGASPAAKYFAPPFILVGPQKVVVDPGANPLTIYRMTLYYTTVMIGIVEWTELYRLTSIGD